MPVCRLVGVRTEFRPKIISCLEPRSGSGEGGKYAWNIGLVEMSRSQGGFMTRPPYSLEKNLIFFGGGWGYKASNPTGRFILKTSEAGIVNPRKEPLSHVLFYTAGFAFGFSNWHFCCLGTGPTFTPPTLCGILHPNDTDHKMSPSTQCAVSGEMGETVGIKCKFDPEEFDPKKR